MAGYERNQGARGPEMLRQLLIDSLVRPRDAARQVLALGVTPEALLQGAVLVTCLGVLLGYLAVTIAPGGSDAMTAALMSRPLVGALAQLAVLAVIVVLTERVGRLFGGTGTLWGALALVVWLNVVMLVIQAGQLVALLVLPPLAGLIAIATLVWMIWAFSNFVAELHGFHHPLKVVAATIMAMAFMFFAIAMLLAMLGFAPQGPS